MEELNRAYEALQKAHDAGDVEGAKQIAEYARSLELTASKADNYEQAPQDDGLGIPESAVGAALGASLGAVAGPAVGAVGDTAALVGSKMINPAAAGAVDMPGSNSPAAVRKWLATQTSNPEAGGRTMGEAFRKSEIAAGKPVQSRGSNVPIRKGNLGISNQLPETTMPQRAAANIINAEKLGKPGVARRMAGMGVAGAELGNMIEEAKQGHYGHAALSGLGALGGAASQSRIKPIRAIGTGIAAGVPLIQKFVTPDDEEEPQKHADGGAIRQTLKHAPGAALVGGLTIPEIMEALKLLKHGKIGEGLGSLAGTAANFVPGALGAASMALTPSELGDSSLYERPSVYEEGQTDILKGSRLPPGHAAGGQIEALAKKLFAPKETKILRASEALGPHEGKWLNTTQSDRMRSTEGDLGGPGFSRFQQTDPAYAGAAWGVGKPGTATAITNVNAKYPEGKAIWSPMIGSETQHHSNQHVFDALINEFARQAGLGKLTPELRAEMNARLMQFPEYAKLFEKGIDVANPESVKAMGDTFDRRGAIATVMSGKGVGGTKGQIFDYPGIMQEMTDPMTVGAPTHAVGTRLFNLSGEVDHRPDLHSAFPYILKGEDQGVAFTPVPKELAIPDWLNLVREFKGREPGYMDYTRGLKGKGTPNQFISEEYLRSLEAAGHKKGGLV